MRKIVATLALLLWLPLAASADESTRIAEVPGTASAAEPGLFAQAQELALRALGFIGVPYKWGGSSPDTGFDCSGLIRFLYAQITGQALPGNAAEISRVGEIIDKSELHAPSRGGAVEIVDMSQRYWKSRYNGARRLPI
jgi:cell wall-associated NlpC family hydrolase